MALYAFDGTWNDSSAPEDQRDIRKDTNVHQFRVRYLGPKEYCHYLDGVGSRGGIIGRYVGGFTGMGAGRRVKEHFKQLTANFAAGETDIDVVGYSRGATIARMFVHKIANEYPKLRVNGRPLERPPTVRFLGLFDTVASFGIPWSATERGFDPRIPDFVAHTFHAMALDETRETFGLERCIGNRDTITEVWFRGGHGDIGGNAVYTTLQGNVNNRRRSNLALRWILNKAAACGVPVTLDELHADHRGTPGDSGQDDLEAPVTALDEAISIGEVGTLSRRIHLGDLTHYSVEASELTEGIDGHQLRRIAVPTRIEDPKLEAQAATTLWAPSEHATTASTQEWDAHNPSLIELSSRRYPFDVLPARTWRAWLERWGLQNPGIADDWLEDFWAPTDPDRGLAWDVYVELRTRVATEDFDDAEWNPKTALESVYNMFGIARQAMHDHGVASANAATMVTAFLNQRIRPFTTRWHKRSQSGDLDHADGSAMMEFVAELRDIQTQFRQLAEALADLVDVRL